MKKTVGLMLVVLLGIAFGVSVALLRIRTEGWKPDFDQRPPSGVTPPRPEPLAGRVGVDHTEYDFGTLDMAAKGTHDFVFTNTGTGPLRLHAGETSCHCTMSKLDREEIPPGGSAIVTLTWTPTDKTGPYHQTAKILTSDPAKPHITLTITGRITVTAQLSPAELVFTRATSSETENAEVRVLCYVNPPLQVLGHQCSDASSARYFDVRLRQLTPAELAESKESPPPLSGMLATVTLKPGLPEGPFRQKIVFRTNIEKTPTLTLPIEGTIGGEIAIAGPGWDADTGILTFDRVYSRKGAERRLLLIVRGTGREHVTFKPVKITPGTLKVTVDRPKPIGAGLVVQTPITIAIPPGSPPENHLGSEQAKLGQVILETTHPKTPKVRILVRFAVEG